MDGIIESILNFGTSFFILENVDVSNEGSKGGFLFVQSCFVCCVYILNFFGNDNIVVEFHGGACSNVKSWCVVCVVDFRMLSSFAFDGKG